MSSVGSVVLYTISAEDVAAINKRRELYAGSEEPDGLQIHRGNPVAAGQEFPMIVTAITPTGLNGQVFLDGNDVIWAIDVPDVPA